MNILFVSTLALSASFTTGSNLRARNTREMQASSVFPLYNQQCRDDAGPPFTDDSETFGGRKYHNGKPAFAVGDCPDPLKGACARKPKTEAFLEGPIDCKGKGWFCRILEEPGWPNIVLNTDVNFGYCNTTEGFNDAGWDRSGHCHGSDSDDTFYWWVRDHWHRQYNGRLRCCCGWDDLNKGTIVNRCDHRRLVTRDENLENCRDANEEGVSPYNGGCDPNNSPALNEPIPEDDSMCWEVQKFGEPDDSGSGGGGGNDNEGDGEGNSPDDEDEGGNDNEGDGEENPPEDEDEGENEDENLPDDSEGDEEEVEEEEENSPDQSPDEEEGEGEDDEEEDEEEEGDNCEDDESFLFKGQRNKNCRWIEKKAERKARLCRRRFVFESCPETCGICSVESEEGIDVR